MVEVRFSHDVLDAIHRELLTVCTEKMREGQSRYFKEQVKFLGCSLPQCNKIAGEWVKRLKTEGGYTTTSY